jgi:TetR/AcrR family transcriptional repressor of nem operon
MKTFDTYMQIVNSALTLVQKRGYNAFSFNDISQLIGIKTASIHYYFPTKADLAKVVVKKHADMLCSVIDQVTSNSNLSYRKMLETIIDSIFAVTYRDNHKMCLGGMLGADYDTLPVPVQDELKDFFKRIQAGLKSLLKKASESGKFKIKKGGIDNEVKAILIMIEGSILLARVYSDENYLTIAKKNIMTRLALK